MRLDPDRANTGATAAVGNAEGFVQVEVATLLNTLTEGKLRPASICAIITRRINGGLNGLADRQMLYARALKVLA